MTLTLVHDAGDAVSLQLLAREIGAKLDAADRDIPVLPLYIAELLAALGVAIAKLDPFGECRHPILGLSLTISWAIKANVSNRDVLIAQADDFCTMIRRVDDDDGWPTDKWLNAVLGCCIALELALKEPDRIRWPAEAGMEVARLVLRRDGCLIASMQPCRTWLCERLRAARHEAQWLNPDHDPKRRRS